MRHDLEVARDVFKTKEKLTLCRTEKGFVEVEKDAIAVPVMSREEHSGYVFHGKGRLVLDAIVETNEGAVGKPIERELTLPFLMLADAKKVADSMSGASSDDLKRLGYKDSEEFARKAQEMLDEHLSRGRFPTNSCYSHSGDGSLFAIPSDTGELDILMAKGSKLLYKSGSMVFMWHDGKAILKAPTEDVVLSPHGRCIITHK